MCMLHCKNKYDWMRTKKNIDRNRLSDTRWVKRKVCIGVEFLFGNGNENHLIQQRASWNMNGTRFTRIWENKITNISKKKEKNGESNALNRWRHCECAWARSRRTCIPANGMLQRNTDNEWTKESQCSHLNWKRHISMEVTLYSFKVHYK